MKDTFEDYLQRLKDRRTEDNYKYTDEDFKDYIHYIFNCYETNLSVYKCLEFMYFTERDIDGQLFNREPKQEKSYSEEEVNNIFYAICKHSFFEDNVETVYIQDVKDEFEQFKNK